MAWKSFTLIILNRKNSSCRSNLRSITDSICSLQCFQLLSKTLDDAQNEEWIAELGTRFGEHTGLYQNMPEEKVSREHLSYIHAAFQNNPQPAKNEQRYMYNTFEKFNAFLKLLNPLFPKKKSIALSLLFSQKTLTFLSSLLNCELSKYSSFHVKGSQIFILTHPYHNRKIRL